MPITMVNPIAATLPSRPDPMEAVANFAEQMQRARENRKQQARQEFDFYIKLTEKTGIVLPEKVLRKTAKDAGLPEGLFSEEVVRSTAPAAAAGPTGPTGGPTPVGPPAGPQGMMGAFQTIAQQTRQQMQAQQLQAQVQQEEAQVKLLKAGLERTVADPKSTDEQRAHAMTIQALMGDKTLQQVIDADAVQHLDKPQREALVQAKEDELLGKPTEAQLREQAARLVPEMLPLYDGNAPKAIEASNRIVRGQPLGPDLQPPMTEQKLKKDIEIAGFGVKMGWTPTMVKQAQALGTTNIAKLSEQYGWNEKQVNALKPLDVQEMELKRREVGAAEARVEIARTEAEASSFERVSRAYSELVKAITTRGNDPEMKRLTALFENFRRAEALKQKVPEAAKKQAMDLLMQEMVGPNGEPLMMQQDVPILWGLLSANEWVVRPPKGQVETGPISGVKGRTPSAFERGRGSVEAVTGTARGLAAVGPRAAETIVTGTGAAASAGADYLLGVLDALEQSQQQLPPEQRQFSQEQLDAMRRIQQQAPRAIR